MDGLVYGFHYYGQFWCILMGVLPLKCIWDYLDLCIEGFIFVYYPERLKVIT